MLLVMLNDIRIEDQVERIIKQSHVPLPLLSHLTLRYDIFFTAISAKPPHRSWVINQMHRVVDKNLSRGLEHQLRQSYIQK